MTINHNKVGLGFWCIGTILVVFLGAVYGGAVVALILNQRIGPSSWLISAVLLAAAYWTVGRRKVSPRFLAGAGIVAAGIIVVVVTVAGLVFDRSFDGLAYHQVAVQQLMDGWNPWYSGGGETNKLNFWTTHYPNATWLMGAQLAALGHELEYSKAINAIALIATVCLACGHCLMAAEWPAHRRLTTWILIGLNPVILSQLFTGYNDGFMASMVAVLAIGMIRTLQGHWGKADLLLIAISALIVVNCKFTGLVYVMVCASIWCLLIWRKFGIRTALRWGTLGCIFVLGSMFLAGYSPYGKNLLGGKHLFYPVLGEGKVDFMSTLRPVNIAEKNRLTRFSIANFSVSQSVRAPESTTLKVPFSVTKNDLSTSWIDTEAGGFGPLFGGCLLLALLLLAWCKWNFLEVDGLFLLAVGMGTCFVHSEGWWARYSPQGWWLACAVGLFAFRQPNRGVEAVRAILLTMLVGNAAIVGGCATALRVHGTLRQERAIAEMKRAGRPIELVSGPFPILRIRLESHGVTVRAIKDKAGAGWNQLPAAFETVYWRSAVTK